MDQPLSKGETPMRRSYMLRMFRASEKQPWRYVLISAETSTRHVFPDLANLIVFLSQPTLPDQHE